MHVGDLDETFEFVVRPCVETDPVMDLVVLVASFRLVVFPVAFVPPVVNLLVRYVAGVVGGLPTVVNFRVETVPVVGFVPAVVDFWLVVPSVAVGFEVVFVVGVVVAAVVSVVGEIL